MIRLFVPQALAAGAATPLTREASHYLLNVMRHGVGDALLVFNGRDGEWIARILEAGKRGAVLGIESLERPQAMGPDLDLIVAVVKRTRVETIVEKAAELGARRVRLALTRRTNADRVRTDRLEAIATEAAEQTGRLDVPVVLEPQKLDRLLDDWEPDRRLMFCDEAGDARPIGEALAPFASGQPWAILIGPEGGFAPEERQRLRALPFTTPVSLGPRILRADTAAISALTLWQSALGDWREAS